MSFDVFFFVSIFLFWGAGCRLFECFLGSFGEGGVWLVVVISVGTTCNSNRFFFCYYFEKEKKRKRKKKRGL
jgi:hypothetical protein